MMYQGHLGSAGRPGLVAYYQKEHEPPGRPPATKFVRSVVRQVALVCARARGAASSKSGVTLRLLLRTLFPSNSIDFVSIVSSYHATAPPKYEAPCALPVAEMNQTRTENVNLDTRSRMHIAREKSFGNRWQLYFNAYVI